MNIFIVGICGKMGRALTDCAAMHGVTVAGGLDRVSCFSYPVFAHETQVNVPFDVIIDFSRPETLPEVCALAERRRCPCVLATTGYGEKEERAVAELSSHVPVFRSANMSVGVQALAYLTEKAARILGGFDIEIIERHHNGKQDAPSGTAKLLCRAAEKGLPYAPSYTFGREGDAPRKKGEIGVHAVRGGTETGTHEVAFYGDNESVTLTHTATSRIVFADGALRAARFLLSQDAGLYGMNDLLSAAFG